MSISKVLAFGFAAAAVQAQRHHHDVDLVRDLCPHANGTSYKTPNGNEFQILCEFDQRPGNMGAQHVDNFPSCIALCSSLKGCLGVAFTKDPVGSGVGWCYPKSEWSQPFYPVEGVWGAKLAGVDCPPVDTCPPVTCPNPESYIFVGAKGGLFKIECGVDHLGGDMGLEYATTFNECIGTYNLSKETTCLHRV